MFELPLSLNLPDRCGYSMSVMCGCVRIGCVRRGREGERERFTVVHVYTLVSHVSDVWVLGEEGKGGERERGLLLYILMQVFCCNILHDSSYFS